MPTAITVGHAISTHVALTAGHYRQVPADVAGSRFPLVPPVTPAFIRFDPTSTRADPT